MMCEKCIYRKNCQFLFKHRKAKAASCTAFKSEAELRAEAIREFASKVERKCIDSGIYPVCVRRALERTLDEMTEKEGGKG